MLSSLYIRTHSTENTYKEKTHIRRKHKNVLCSEHATVDLTQSCDRRNVVDQVGGPVFTTTIEPGRLSDGPLQSRTLRRTGRIHDKHVAPLQNQSPSVISQILETIDSHRWWSFLCLLFLWEKSREREFSTERRDNRALPAAGIAKLVDAPSSAGNESSIRHQLYNGVRFSSMLNHVFICDTYVYYDVILWVISTVYITCFNILI